MPRSLALFALIAIVLSACSSAPPRPKHVLPSAIGPIDGRYLGEANDHVFLKQSDGRIIFTDTEDLSAGQQARVRALGKVYSGTGSKIRRH